MTTVEAPQDIAARLSERITELERWMLITAWDLKERWVDDFPPLVYPQEARIDERPYTTAAIYLVRLAEFAEQMPSLSPREPREIAPQRADLERLRLRIIHQELEQFIEQKKTRLCEQVKTHGPEHSAGVPGMARELLREGPRIDARYASGYIAQALLAKSAGSEFDELNATLVKVLQTSLGLHPGDDETRELGVANLFVSRSMGGDSFPRATHANAFLTYLAYMGLVALGGVDAKQRDELVKHVDERTHYLLAKGLVKETAEFDPGELAYSLATRRQLEVDRDRWWLNGAKREFIREALAFVFMSQSEDGLWNAGRPWKYSPEGGALHMISLERSNAILEILGSEVCVESGLFEEFEEKIDRTYRWLTRTRQDLGGGWTSEHSFEFGTRIDFWVNAHALRFFILYRQGLLRYLERLVLKQFVQVKRASLKRWDDIIDPKLGKTPTVREAVESSLPKSGQFHDPRWNYSFLLYGPPGTSKTTMAEAIASTVGTPLIVITSSDFIARGVDAIEAQVSYVFRLLMALPWGVVLFDEIDEFIEDRESARNKTSQFRFMTTSMLPKLQDLRDRRKVVVLIATNYRERIDLAVKRPPRIDREILTPPPGSAARRAMVEAILSNETGARKAQVVDLLEREGQWYSFAELRQLARGLMQHSGDVKDAYVLLKSEIVAAASYRIYAARWENAENPREADVVDELMGVIKVLELEGKAVSDLVGIRSELANVIRERLRTS
jgi:ATPase family associated with various cellular activities (AAA)